MKQEIIPPRYIASEDHPAIVFAFFDSEGTLVGFRQDTVGTIGEHAKIYHHSTNQVKIVLDNIQSNIDNPRPEIVDFIKGADPKAGAIIGNELRRVNNTLKDLKNFEVRVLPCPDYDDQWGYPDMEMFKLQAVAIEPLEVHKYNL